ncbi:MAG: F0F1 ATP synthase subunit B [Patescibacteria group bacterium]
MDKLGIEPSLLLAQIVNFLVILVLLNKLLYKPILTMLEKRKKEIEDTVKITERLKKDEARMEEKHEKVLTKAREEASSIIEEAKKQAKDVEKELIAKAHEEAFTIITRGKEEAKEVVTRSHAAVAKQAVELAVVMAKRLLDGILNAKEQHDVIGKKIKDLEVWANRL